MMKRTALILAVITALLIGLTPTLYAQDAPDYPPTIISFTSDVMSITLADAEAGQTVAKFQWEILGWQREQHTISLETYKITGWESLLAPDEAALRNKGNRDVTVEHPNNFGPPTYRLSIADNAGNILDQRMLVIDYNLDAVDEPPRIVSFYADEEAIDPADLANGTARVTLTWNVANRTPDTNLVFEQVLPDGTTVSVEQPRPNIWVPSTGVGAVKPVSPGAGQLVQLRIRVIEILNGETVAETALAPLPVTADAAQYVPPPTPAQPAEPIADPVQVPDDAQMPPDDTGPAAVQVALFTIAPEIVSRGGIVTLTWNVQGAADLGIYLLEPGGPIAGFPDNPAAQGTWTVTIPEGYVDNATFMLSARDAAGNVHNETLTVDIICPFTYFFGPGYDPTCPLDSMRTVQAAYQRFERGIMVWRADTSDIYVLFDNGMVNRFKDTWMGEVISFPEPAPDGMLQPHRGFGTVWINNPQVRVELGWATGFEESYIMRFQPSGHYKYGRLYFDLPDGQVVYIVENVWHPLGE